MTLFSLKRDRAPEVRFGRLDEHLAACVGVGGKSTTCALALGAYQKAEIEKWWPIIKAANIKAD
jgi:hypothetical protein